MLKPDKTIDFDKIQLNLILSSLYLSSFEILKSAIIDSVSSSFVYLAKPDMDYFLSLKDYLSEDEYAELCEMNIGSYQKQVDEYIHEVGGEYEKRKWLGLMPSCKWLEKVGVITQQDVDFVRKLREHRNSIAHELPKLITGENYAVNIDYLEETTKILKKVGTYIARLDADIPYDVPDKNIASGREILLSIIWESVVRYLNDQTKSYE